MKATLASKTPMLFGFSPTRSPVSATEKVVILAKKEVAQASFSTFIGLSQHIHGIDPMRFAQVWIRF